MPDPFDDWLARAEKAKRLAAVQASYGLDAGSPSGRSAASSTQQLKFLNIIGDLDPRLIRPRAQQQQQQQQTPSAAQPQSTSRSPQRGGQSLLTAALQEQKKSQATTTAPPKAKSRQLFRGHQHAAPDGPA
ncbi:hypothetical protein AURDEDRAFT_167953 [Auricularia subglabra TFB-10046 SS5]|nr:hypothetical protein AURDEDRAFT_167953 [Auricularia subglabra TFB-10046 SS5]